MRTATPISSPCTRGYPPGLSTADNEAGWRSSLEKLAALVEAG
jgi:hypothetical protein